MTEHAEIKELRKFGLIVGGIFLVLGLLATRMARRRYSTMGAWARSNPRSIGACRPGSPGAGLPNMDESRTCARMDKYQDHTWYPVLRFDHPDGDGDAIVWMGFHASCPGA